MKTILAFGQACLARNKAPTLTNQVRVWRSALEAKRDGYAIRYLERKVSSTGLAYYRKAR